MGAPAATVSWCRRADTLLPSDPLTAAVAHYRNHSGALTRFIDDARVPLDSSPTEREFQNFAKLRLDLHFAGSTEGDGRAASVARLECAVIPASLIGHSARV